MPRRKILADMVELDAVVDYTQGGVRPAVEPSTPGPEPAPPERVVDYTQSGLTVEPVSRDVLKGVPGFIRRDRVKLARYIEGQRQSAVPAWRSDI